MFRYFGGSWSFLLERAPNSRLEGRGMKGQSISLRLSTLIEPFASRLTNNVPSTYGIREGIVPYVILTPEIPMV
jgi:hypothetical protein